MDRLAVHVIATAALTVTLATVPALFADACHASSTAAGQLAVTATGTALYESSARPSAAALPPAVAVLPALSGPAQTPAAEAAAARPALPAEPAPAASRAAQTPTHPGRGRRLFPSEPRHRCADLEQIGHTAYARYRGIIAFSVRQYYSADCHTYYGYSYAWHRFRRLHVPFDVGMAVFAVRADAIDGAVSYAGGHGGPGYWSAAVTAHSGECTQGEGHFFYYPADAPGGFIEADTMTAPTCAQA